MESLEQTLRLCVPTARVAKGRRIRPTSQALMRLKWNKIRVSSIWPDLSPCGYERGSVNLLIAGLWAYRGLPSGRICHPPPTAISPYEKSEIRACIPHVALHQSSTVTRLCPSATQNHHHPQLWLVAAQNASSSPWAIAS